MIPLITVTVTILQVADKVVAKAGFRYVLAVSTDDDRTPKATVARSMSDLISMFRQDIKRGEWAVIEAALALDGVWKREVTDPLEQQGFLNTL